MSARRRQVAITAQQALIHGLFMQHRSMSDVARLLGITQIRVREALVQYQRNTMRMKGLSVPPLREMMRGDVTTRFGISREERGGRPAVHEQFDPVVAGHPDRERPSSERQPAISNGADARRVIVTAVEAGARVHQQFWRNLCAFARRVEAEIMVYRVGAVGLVGEGAPDLRQLIRTGRTDIGAVAIAADVQLPLQSSRPLDSLSGWRPAEWTIAVHPVIQLETKPRIRADGLAIHMTTGAVTIGRRYGSDERPEVGAVIVEIGKDGHGHCRHLLAAAHGDGSFQDLDRRVRDGIVTNGCRAEAIVFGDIHHAHLDPAVAAATWGLPPSTEGPIPLVDRLRPRSMVFHDLVDFEARNHHDANDHHKRFEQMVNGRGEVRVELEAASRFLAATGREDSQSIVVSSNHDQALVRWLREADIRNDPLNAIFFHEAALLLHKRLADGKSADGLFEQVLRRLSDDGLSRVRFLRTGESLKLAGIEHAIHGHQGADGKRGTTPFFERLGISATLGHSHRPTTRDGIYWVGVSQTELPYARGPLTGWAVGHVATYASGARQHLIFNGGRFFE